MIIDSSGNNPTMAIVELSGTKIDTKSTNNDSKSIKKVRKNA